MKLRFLVGAAIAAMLPFFGVAEIYTLAGADASTSPTASSSMSGTGTGAAGWTDSLGVTTKNHVPSAGNDYVANGPAPDFLLRTPTTSGFTFGGDSLTLTGGAEMKVKIGSGGTVTIPNLIVAGEARISHGDGNQIKKIAGAIDIREDGAVFFDLSFDNSGGNARQFEILSTISGSGILRAGASDPVKSGTPWIKFLGSLADFTGKLVVQANGTAKLETYFQSSLPGDPAEETADGLTVEGGNAVLKFNTSGTLGNTRGIFLNSETCEIYVDAGKTVQIDGLLTGTSGFKKTGAGTLVLARISPELSGTVTVEEGTLQLCGIPSEVLPNVTTVSVSSDATLDENGPAYGEDTRVKATLTGVEVVEDGQPHGPVLTVTDPAEGSQAVWSTDGITYVSTCPTFTEPGEYTVFCHVSASGYMTRGLRTTVLIRTLRRVVATAAEKEGVWAEATVAGDDAYAAIQGVIDSCGIGDLVLVKAGTYLLTNELAFTSADQKGVILRSDDGAGNLARKTTLFVGGYPATTNRLVRIAAPDAIVEGFTLTNGYVNGVSGGGAYLYDCGADGGLRNCDILGCTAWHQPFVTSGINKTDVGTGGGVYIYKTGCVSNCLIRANTAFAGGAVYLQGTISATTPTPLADLRDVPRVTACALVENQIVGYGNANEIAGSALSSINTACLDHTTVVSNRCNVTTSAQYTTAGNKSGTLVISNCVFEANHLGTKQADLISANGADRYICVGSTFIREGTKTAIFRDRCVCDGNAMIDCQGYLSQNLTQVRNCLFYGNTNNYCLSNGRITVENCTFVGNKGAIYTNGGGVDASRTNRVVNSVFVGNTDDIYGINEGNAKPIALFLSNCCIRASSLDRRVGTNRRFGLLVMNDCNIIYENGKLDLKDLGFVAPREGDFRLREGSILLDKGMTLDWMDGASDADGNPRVVGLAPDIGCYERQEDAIDPPVHFVRAVATEADKKDEWADAYVGLQAAADAACGEPVYVKSGTYSATEPVVVRNWGVEFIGAGTGATIVDGGAPNPTHRVFTIEAANVTLRNLTIRNGLASNSDGGGVYVTGTDFTMTNCVVENCTALRGGGASFGKTFAVLDCVFTNCSTTAEGSNQRGGGIYCGTAVENGVIEECDFLGCATYKDAPGCYLESSCKVTDCLFEGNRDLKFSDNQSCYGVIYSAKSQTVERCVFSTNIMRRVHAAALEGTSVVRDCIVVNHPRLVGSTCGENGVFFRSGGSARLQVVNCRILDTYAESIIGENTDLSGCILSNVTMSFLFGRDGNKIRNCIFTGCPEPILLANCTYENCSFINNVGGGCLKTKNSGAVSPALTNCVFWANTPSTAYRGNSGIAVIKNDFGATNRVKMANCVLQTTEETSTEAPNMCDADKSGATAELTAKAIAAGQELFVAPGRGDWRLRKDSPLVDAGVPCDWMEDATDLDGKPRFIGMAPDVGCYERQGDEIDPPYSCTRAVAKEEDKTDEWADAIVGLAEALEAACIDEPLYVKAGTYDVAETATASKWGIRIIGEGADKTIINGGYPALSNRIFTINTPNVTLRDLTIRNGWYGDIGGGLYASKSAVGIVMTNCVVENCTALRGGGAYFDAPFTLIDCTFTNCSTTADGSNRRGGAIYCGNDVAIRGVIDLCRFLGCAAAHNGSSCYLDAPCTTTDSFFGWNGITQPSWSCNGVIYSQKVQTIARCTFSTNVIGNSTLCANLLGNSVVADCVVENHPNVGKTPTLFSRSTGSDIVQVVGCLIRDTYADYVFSAGVNMDRCVFSNVTLRTAVDNNNNGKVRNSLFTGCQEPIRVRSSIFENCSFVGNAGGVALNGKTYSPAFTNCVFWANGIPAKDYYGSMGLYVQKDDFTATNRVTMANCVLQANEETSPNAPDMRDADKSGKTAELTAAVIARGPRFVSPANGDWHLKSSSPLRDKGLVLDWMTDEAVDLDGKPRRIDTDGKAYPDSLPDIGCYECAIPKPGLLLQVR